jgi:F-type H+-transporting ATPase subunit alpha
LFRQGVLPAVDVGRSVSRVGGEAQLPAYRAVAGDLRLAYSQFEELERFSRYGTRMDDDTRRKLEHGRRIREILKQPETGLMTVDQQIRVLLAANEGTLDKVPSDRVDEAESAVLDSDDERLADIEQRITSGEKLTDEDRKVLTDIAADAVAPLAEGDDNGDA